MCRGELGGEELEALLRGHVFHANCITRYQEVSKMERWECCPFKCHHTEAVATQRLASLRDTESQAQTQPAQGNQPVEVMDDVAADAELAID